MRAARSRRPLVAIATVLLAASIPATSRAAVQIEASVQVVPVARAPRLDIDVWTNKDEGGVYRQGEAMRVFFRPSDDAYVLIYNIDTEGYIHLVYPYDPGDPDRVEGGRTYQVPARNDPYDLVADGPAGIEYVVAIASPFPFRNLPWYLNGDNAGRGPDEYGDDEDDDYGESGQIAGDPYVGMDRVVRQIVPHGRENDVATADTYFYIERRVEYPRYVCADCHSYGWYDPYVDVCSVFDVRIDATWAHYRPLRSAILRPRYYYMVRSTAPTRYRQWKDRWSSIDGRATLRERFRVDSGDKFQSRRQMIQRRTPPEFQNFRTRPRPEGRIFRRDEVLRRDPARGPNVRDRGDGGEVRDRGDVRDSQDARRRAWEQWRDQRQNDRRQMQEPRRDDQRQMQEQRRDDQRQMQEQRRDDQRQIERERPRVQERDNARRDNSGDRGQVRERRDSGGDRGGDRGNRGSDRGGDRGDRGGGGGRGRGDDRGR